MSRTVDLWLDLRSPYSFLAKDPAYALEKEFGATVRLRPFSLEIAGALNLNDPAAVQRGLRKIKYLYADARRFANPRGITLLGPKKIFDQKLVHLAWLYADRAGKGRELVDLALEGIRRAPRGYLPGDSAGRLGELAESLVLVGAA